MPLSKRPNILFLFTDQQRADTIAALGNPVIHTPNLDRLVREGTSFTRCYTPSPVCMPARYATLTGLPPHLSGCTDNQSALDLNRTTYASLLSGAGYQCHAIGKMHLAPDHRAPVGFESRDISEELKAGDFPDHLARSGYGHVLDPHGLRGEYYYLPQPSQLPAHLHESAWVADRAIHFLKERDPSRPFMLYAGFIKPHPPFESPTPWNRLYRGPDMPAPYRPADSTAYQSRINRVQNRYKYMDQAAGDDRLFKTMKAAYYGAISFIDHQIGRILEALGPEIDHTLIVFSSDHGELLGDYGCVGKRCMLEASVRVPLLARLPGVFLPGQRCAIPVSLCDLYPTFAALASVSGNARSCASEAAPLWESVARSEPPRYVCSQFQQGWMGNYMISDGTLKYAYSAPDHREWLWRIGDDLRESEDLSAQGHHASDLKRLRFFLHERLRSGGHHQAVDERGWRIYEAPAFKGDADPNYGLIYQDGPELASALAGLPLGYPPSRARTDAENYRIILDHQG